MNKYWNVKNIFIGICVILLLVIIAVLAKSCGAQ